MNAPVCASTTNVPFEPLVTTAKVNGSPFGSVASSVPVSPFALSLYRPDTATGATLIVTTNDPAAALPAASTALHATVVEPTPNVDPLAGAHATATLPSTASTAVAE